MGNDVENLLPNPPVFADELVERCKRDRDFRPILFEWYKYIGILCNRAACLDPESPAFRRISAVHYAVLIGLLNRCSRLMVANIRLSCSGRYGETTRLLDRSIAETAIKVRWLCHKDDSDSFRRYLADGLKKDLELNRHIGENVGRRGGETLVIEARMLWSIQKRITLSGLSEQEVKDAKKLPDFAAMCRDLDLDDLFYTAIQRMGSHAVHGTWSDLMSNYLRHEDGQGFRPRDHEIETQDAQYIVVGRLVLGAIGSFLDYIAADSIEVEDFISALEAIEAKLIKIQELAWISDFGKE